MSQFRKGILGLPLYNPELKKWGQAHTQGAFVLSMWIMKKQDQDNKYTNFFLKGNLRPILIDIINANQWTPFVGDETNGVM